MRAMRSGRSHLVETSGNIRRSWRETADANPWQHTFQAQLAEIRELI